MPIVMNDYQRFTHCRIQSNQRIDANIHTAVLANLVGFDRPMAVRVDQPDSPSDVLIPWMGAIKR